MLITPPSRLSEGLVVNLAFQLLVSFAVFSFYRLIEELPSLPWSLSALLAVCCQCLLRDFRTHVTHFSTKIYIYWIYISAYINLVEMNEDAVSFHSMRLSVLTWSLLNQQSALKKHTCCLHYITSLPFICPVNIVIPAYGNFFLSTQSCIRSVVVFVKYCLRHMLCW